MKIGIMSMQRVINYGSYLQAYGLRATLEAMGHTVEFVDYLAEPSLVQEVPGGSSATLLEKIKRGCKLLSPAYREFRAKQIRMNQSFSAFYDRFVQEFLQELGVPTQMNLCSELDALVIGSDEVFNCTQAGDTVGYSLQLFGKDHRAKKLISYAASFGSTTMEKLNRFGVSNEIGMYLSRFNSISVRDENSADIVRALCGTEPQQNIDPVLLYGFPEVDQIDVPHRDYLVVYAYAGRISEEEAKAIRAFAKKYHKKIISLGFYQPFCDEYVQATPMEALAYMKHADYVVTDTFHGTVFSIKYQKQFATIIRNSNNQKLGDLLRRFHLEQRAVVNLGDLDRILHERVPADHIKMLLSEYQASALEYLRHALTANQV